MMDNGVFCLVLFVMLVVGVLLGVGFHASIFEPVIISDVCDCPDMWSLLQEEFLSSREYKRGEYNCVNYSQDWAAIRELLGYETYAYHNVGERHMYVLEAVEPQTGRLRKVKK